MTTKSIKKETLSRFDTRLPKAQKQFFEKAASLGGFRNLTDFILSAAQEKAKEIVTENEQITLSRRDAEIFYQAVTRQHSQSSVLMETAEEYKKEVSK